MPQIEKIINSKIKRHIYVIEWLTPDEQVIDEVTVDVISGSVNFDGTKSNRRSMDITLKNLDGKYIPTPNKLWVNHKFRLKAGYEYGGKKLLFNQGIYCLGNPSVLSTPARKEITLHGIDKWGLLDGTLTGKLKNKIIIPVGTRVDSAINGLMIDIVGENKLRIDYCSTKLPYTIEAESGSTISSLIEEIAYIVSYEAFYDNEGFFIFRKFLEISEYEQTVSSWSYTTKGLYLESNRELSFDKIKNSILVVGDTLDDGTLIYATSKDESNSDMSINAIGERFEKIEDSNITTISLAQQRSDWELQQLIMLAETVRMSIIPNFSHKVGDVISVTDSNNGAKGNYVIQFIDYDISYDSMMNVGLWKIRDWR